MKKRICATLIALVAVGVAASAAQATELIGPEAKEVANGAAARVVSANLTAETSAGAVTCTSSTFEGEVTADQGEAVKEKLTKSSLSGCTAFGLKADVSTNVSSEKPWTLEIQKPAENEHLTAHLVPSSGSELQFNVQVQLFGSSVATCDFTASSVQFAGEAGSNHLTIEGSNQLKKKSGSSTCGGETGTLSGELEDEANGEWTTAVAALMPKLCKKVTSPCPKGEDYATPRIIKAALPAGKESVFFLGKPEFRCTVNETEGEMKNSGPAIVGDWKILKFDKCSEEGKGKVTCTIEALNLPYGAIILPTDSGNGTLHLVDAGLEFKTKCGAEECFYKRDEVKLGIQGAMQTVLSPANEILKLNNGAKNGAACSAFLTWSVSSMSASLPAAEFFITRE